MPLYVVFFTFISHLEKCEVPLESPWDLESEDLSMNFTPIIYLMLGKQLVFLNLNFIVE